MQKSRNWMTFGIAFAIANACLSPNAFARKGYNTQFWELYPSMKEHKETQCGVCHGKEKKICNDYGKAVGVALVEVKVSDVAKIKAALSAYRKAIRAVEGSTVAAAKARVEAAENLERALLKPLGPPSPRRPSSPTAARPPKR